MIEFEKIYNQYFKDVYKFVSHVKFTDGYQVNREKFTMDEYGNFYVTPYLSSNYKIKSNIK